MPDVSISARSATFFAVVLAAALGLAQAATNSPPSGWVRIAARKFELSVPPDVKSVPVQGIDSFVGEYKGTDISLAFDYGIFSSSLKHTGSPDFVSSVERIDGMTARVVSFHNPGSGHAFDHAIGVHFAEVGGKERTWAGTNKLRLTVFATCKSTNDYETVRTIFRTIHFR